MNKAKRRSLYTKPRVEVFILQQGWHILETASLEGDVMDFEDGENL